MKISANAALKAMGVRLVGINYKDAPANALQLLAADGNPYAAIGDDLNGRVGIDWGATGVPETFIIRGDGTVAFKFTGPITERAFKETVLPEIEKTMR
jgi:cytochrome c biogenesis protein CcmG/thiol:disulfide interchange protein DsbE